MISTLGLHTSLDALNRVLRDCEKEGMYVKLKVVSPNGDCSVQQVMKLELDCVAAIPKPKFAP